MQLSAPAAVAEPKDRLWIALGKIQALLFSPLAWFIFGLAWVALNAYADRQSTNPDALSEIDMALNAVKGQPESLLNGYWSPAYPTVLAAVLWAFPPSPDALYPLVNAVNVALFSAAFWAFAFFLRHWITALAPESGGAGRYWIPFGFAIFLWHAVELIWLTQPATDLCVAAVCFVAAGMVAKLSKAPSRWTAYAGLGAALGVGFYFKAAMLPIGVLGLGILWAVPPSRLIVRRQVVWAAAAFLMVIAPLVALYSHKAGHLTTGETGRLNYVWYVNRFYMHTGWTEAGEHGTPAHAPRVLMREPATVLEFAGPLAATFPLWYDPSYWYEGVKVRFNLAQQMETLKTNLSLYGVVFHFMNGLIAGMVLFLTLLLRDRTLPIFDRRWSWMMGWPLAVFGMYEFVYVEPRFVVAFSVILWLSLYAVLGSRVGLGARKVLLTAVALTMLLPSMVKAGMTARVSLQELAHPSRSEYQKAADVLDEIGLRAGDRIAVLGEGFGAEYAQPRGYRIAAMIPSEEDYWRLDGPSRDRVDQVLSSAGVRALVASEKPAKLPAGWRDVSGSIYAILPLTLRYP